MGADVTGSAAFYQAALVLIPVLLYGSTLYDLGKLQREAEDKGRGKKLRFVLLLVLLFGLFAQAVAIRGSIEPWGLQEWEQRCLIAFITVGIAGFALWAASPLLEKRRGVMRMAGPQVAVYFLIALSFGQWWVGKSLDTADAHTRFEELSRGHIEATRSLQAAEERNLAAREKLIDYANSMEAKERAVALARALIERLRQARKDGPNALDAENAVGYLNVSFDEMRKSDPYLEALLKSRLPGLGPVERELFVLSERRLIAAMGVVMSSVATKKITLRELRNVCDSKVISDETCP